MEVRRPSLKKISQNLTDPFSKNATFVVFEQCDHLVKMSLVKVVSKRILVQVVFYYPSQSHQAEDVLKSIKELVKKYLSSNGNYHFLILTDHHLATTSRSGVSLVRPEPEVKITPGEEQNLISKSLWKIFSNQRLRASKKTDTPDIDLNLVDTEFLQIKLDKNRVMDPVGFSAKTFEFWAKQTIVSKKMLTELYDIIPEEEIIFFCETAGLVSDAIFSTIDKKEDFLLADIGISETAFYRSRGNSFYFLDKIRWGTDNIFKAISTTLALAKEQAYQIFDIYQNQTASPATLKKLSDLITEEVAIVLKGIEQYQKKSNLNKVYIHSFLQAPELFNNSDLKKKVSIKTKFISVDKDLIGQKLDFDLKLNHGVGNQENFAALICAIKHHELVNINPALEKITKQRSRLLKDA